MPDFLTRADLTEALAPVLTRLGGLETRMERLEVRADKTEQTLERIIALTLETRLTLLEEIRAEIRGRSNTSDTRFDSTTQQLETVQQEQMLERHARKRLQRRVRRLERHTGLQPES